MKVDREVSVDAAPGVVWDALLDVPRMVGCVPGCVEGREVEACRRWQARMTQRVGPITLSLPLTVEALKVDDGRYLELEARGRDPILGATISMRVGIQLEPDDQRTRMRVTVEGRVLGKLGALGQGMIQRKAEETFDLFTSRFRQTVEA